MNIFRKEDDKIESNGDGDAKGLVTQKPEDQNQTEPAGAMERLATGDESVETHEVGATVELKLLYETRGSYCSCCQVWDDQEPASDHPPGASEKTFDKFAVLRRQTRHGQGTWKTHSIVVNSNEIRKTLKDVFSDYPDLDPYASKLVFKPPFRSFIHRWSKLNYAFLEEENATTRAHLSLLLKTLKPEVEESFKTLQTIRETGFVSFHDIDLVYLTGDIIVQDQKSQVSAGVLCDMNLNKAGETSYYSFTVDVVDWNGEKFGKRQDTWLLWEYKGSREIATLEILPLEEHPTKDKMREELIRRGRKFEALKGQHFCAYAGKASVRTSSGPYLPPMRSFMPVSERVIVDAKSYYALQNKVAPDLRPLKSGAEKPDNGTHLEDPFSTMAVAPKTASNLKSLSKVEFSAVLSSMRDSGLQDEMNHSSKIQELSDDECLLAVSWVNGFAVGSKVWCDFHIDDISDIVWNTSTMQNLVVSDQQKRLLTALVTSQDEEEDQPFDDFVEGKGKGVIILLSGPPGVGKTLTAETLAEHLKRPLYRLGASDLGTVADQLEDRLRDALLRCATWNAVLLIDEADVFLEARTTDSLERNEIISVFLRLLEYYSGLLILTTNRVSSLDSAFESRIDVTLNYEQLSLESQAQIMGNFLKTLPPGSAEVTHDELVSLMKQPLNGRQIKSAVKTARILARSEGSKLKIEHLQLVIDLRTKASEFANQNK